MSNTADDPASASTGDAAPDRPGDAVPRPLDVLFVTHNQTERGGAYYRARSLARPLARRGHRTAILAIHPTERWRLTERTIDGIRVVESPDLLPGVGRSGWDPWDTVRRTTWIARQRFDVIHTIDTRPAVSVPAFLARRRARAVWIADWTDWWGRGGATSERAGLASRVMGPIEQFFEERPRPHADGTIVISRALAERAAGLGIPVADQLYLPPGADPADVRDVSVADARRSLGIDDDGLRLGYLGNIYPRDAELMFDALRQSSHPVRLVMVGESGATVPADLADRVDQLGRLPFGEMLDQLSACDALVLPLTDSIANRGRWPSKINEYVAVGRPTIACAVGDITELVRDHRIGLVCEPRPDEFAAAIDQVLADRTEREAMGRRARELALAEYSQDQVAARLERYYFEVLERRRVAKAG
jgi:glycosyltransferase involved in cell wall biosynthesis